MPELAAIIARLEPQLGPLEGDPRPLDGGITNRNYRVRMGGEDLVLRLCGHGTEVLGIDRSTEEIAARRAAAEQIAPPVVAFLSDVPALVTRWLPRRAHGRGAAHAGRAGPGRRGAAPAARLAAAADRLRGLPPRRGASRAGGHGAAQLRALARARAAHRGGADRPRARARALPQRPAHRELPAR
jgi:hypothetical protein